MDLRRHQSATDLVELSWLACIPDSMTIVSRDGHHDGDLHTLIQIVYGVQNFFRVWLLKRKEYDLWRKSLRSEKPTVSKAVSDCLYIWKCIDRTDEYGQIYKIGITSTSCMDERIKKVSRLHGVDYEIVVWTRQNDPRAIEAQILSIGRRAKMTRLEGHTEFRSLSEADLAQVLDIIGNK